MGPGRAQSQPETRVIFRARAGSGRIAKPTNVGCASRTWRHSPTPAATPHPVVTMLNRAIVKDVTQPETRQRLASIGAEVVASSPEQYSRFIKNELRKWPRIIKKSGASAH